MDDHADRVLCSIGILTIKGLPTWTLRQGGSPEGTQRKILMNISFLGGVLIKIPPFGRNDNVLY